MQNDSHAAFQRSNNICWPVCSVHHPQCRCSQHFGVPATLCNCTDAHMYVCQTIHIYAFISDFEHFDFFGQFISIYMVLLVLVAPDPPFSPCNALARISSKQNNYSRVLSGFCEEHDDNRGAMPTGLYSAACRQTPTRAV